MSVTILFYISAFVYGIPSFAFFMLTSLWLLEKDRKNNRFRIPFIISAITLGISTVAVAVIISLFFQLDFRELPMPGTLIFFLFYVNAFAFSIPSIAFLILLSRWLKDKDRKNSRFRKPFIISAIALGISTVSVVVITALYFHDDFSRGIPMPATAISDGRGPWINSSVNTGDYYWSLSTDRTSGFMRYRFYLSKDMLDNLRVGSRSSQGIIYFTLRQGNISKTMDISNTELIAVDTSGFEPGDFILLFEVEQGLDLTIELDWSGG